MTKKRHAKYEPALKKIRMVPDTIATGSSGQTEDWSSRDSVSTLQLTRENYLGLMKVLNRDIGKKIELVTGDGELFGSLVLLHDAESEKAASGKSDVKEKWVSCFFLNWVNDSNTGSKYRGMRVSLVASGNQQFLNITYSPVKFLSGQNTLPVRDGELWFGKKILHTPAGYMKLAYNLLALHMKQLGLRLKDYVDPSVARWHGFHLAELIDCQSAEVRDRVLRFIDTAWDWSWSERIDGVKYSYSARTLFHLEVRTHQSEEKDDEPPSIHMTRVSRRRGDSTVSKPYTILFYPKDVEVENNRSDTSRLDETVMEAMGSSIRIEFRITPDVFTLEEVRKFILSQGWLDEEDMADRSRYVATLHKLFPDQKTMEQRWPVLSQIVWQESSVAVMLNPPSILDIKAWALGKSALTQKVVEAWVEAFRSPLPRARGAFNSMLFGKAKLREIESVYEEFRVRWGFDLNRVPRVALVLMFNALNHATFSKGERSRIATMEYEIECLHLAGQKQKAMAMEGELQDFIAEAKKNARQGLKTMRASLSSVKPNTPLTLSIKARTS